MMDALSLLIDLRKRVDYLETQENPLRRITGGYKLPQDLKLDGGLNLGTATGATAGTLYAAGGRHIFGTSGVDTQIGIGTSPSYPGTGVANAGMFLYRFAGDNGGSQLGALGTGGLTVKTVGAGPLHLGTNNTNRLTVAATGEVLMTQWLNVGNAAVNYVPTTINWGGGGTTLLLNGADTTSIGFHDAANRVDFITCGGGTMVLGHNGGWGSPGVEVPGVLSVGGTPIAAYRTLIYGATSAAGQYALVVRNSGGSNLMYLENNGLPWVNQAWFVASDARLKDNVEDLDDELAKIRRVRWRSYKRKISGTQEYGVVAQELREVYPELVTEHTPPGATEPELAVNYQGLAIAQGKALAELAAEVDELKARNSELERRMLALEAMVRGRDGK